MGMAEKALLAHTPSLDGLFSPEPLTPADLPFDFLVGRLVGRPARKGPEGPPGEGRGISKKSSACSAASMAPMRPATARALAGLAYSAIPHRALRDTQPS